MTEHVVVVGGGTGGTVLANRLADELAEEVAAGEASITLVNDGPDHVYKPVWLYVAFGRRELDDGVRPLDDLLAPAVDLRVGRVEDVDTGAKRLGLADGELDYDHLVVATGAEIVPEDVPGLAAAGHNFYSPGGATRLRDELAEFTAGHLVLSVAGRPHMCPAAPLEFVLMADDWFRRRGVRDEVEMTYTYPLDRLHGKASISEWAEPRFEERQIQTETGFEVESADPDADVLWSTSGVGVDFDLLVGIPPHRGVDLVADAGLGDSGWVEVDEATLEATAAEDVYAMGDAAATPAPKAGSAAHYQAGVVADRIASRVRGRTPTALYDGKTICFLEAGMDDATFVSFDYETEPTLRDESRAIHWAKLAYNESYWLTARGLL
jgi:sulfide:quinone oxidoreductase